MNINENSSGFTVFPLKTKQINNVSIAPSTKQDGSWIFGYKAGVFWGEDLVNFTLMYSGLVVIACMLEYKLRLDLMS